jgi:hypothetical protein
MKNLCALVVFWLLSSLCLAQVALFSGQEPLNRPFFQANKELPLILAEAVQAGKLQPYTWVGDTLFRQGKLVKMTQSEWAERLLLPQKDTGRLAGEEPGWGDAPGTPAAPEPWQPRDMTLVGWGQVNGGLYLSLFVPGEVAHPATDAPASPHYLASFRGEDCARVLASDPRAVWLPPQPANFGPWLPLGPATQDALTGFLVRAGQKGWLPATAPGGRLLTAEEFAVRHDRARQGNAQFSVILRDRPSPSGQGLVPDSLVLVAEPLATPGQLQEVACFAFADFGQQAPRELWAPQVPILDLGEALAQRLFVPLGAAAALPTAQVGGKARSIGHAQTSDLILGHGRNQVLFRPRKELVRLLTEAQRKGRITAFRRWPTPSGDSLAALPRTGLAHLLTDTLTGKPRDLRAFNRLGWEERVVLAQGQKTYEPAYLTLILPAELNGALGIDAPVAWFAHADVLALLRRTGKAKFTDKSRAKNRRRNYADLLTNREVDLLVYETGPVTF